MAESSSGPLHQTPLHAEHVAAGARMVPFAGYDMPVQYPAGIIAEHNHTRSSAGLFDVSHMGQALLRGRDHASVAAALERLVPADILNLGRGRQRYSQFLNPEGGVIDDLMILRPASPDEDGTLGLIVNASRKDVDFELIRTHIGPDVEFVSLDDRGLVALQGPQAAAVLAQHIPEAASMPFMAAAAGTLGGIPVTYTRSGYTGEDGYEISMPAADAAALWRLLLEDARVKPIGLGARDSLRLEAGLCLYGHELDETTSPVEADLTWSIQKRRRTEGGFPGAERLQREWAEGCARRRVGLIPEGRSPVREGAVIRDAQGRTVGVVTSGGFGPTVGHAVAQAYVPVSLAEAGTQLTVELRGKDIPARVAPMPFAPHRYHRS